MVEYRAQFRGTPNSVRLAREAIVDYARCCGFGSDVLGDIALAAGEALANAVEHGNRDLGYIEISCEIAGETLAIEIRDAGTGFDLTRIQPRKRDPNAVRGFGISIMHAIMDGVSYTRRGAAVRLTKRPAGDLRERTLRGARRRVTPLGDVPFGLVRALVDSGNGSLLEFRLRIEDAVARRRTWD